MPHVWPHAQLSHTGAWHVVKPCVSISSYTWRMVREWLDVRNWVELSLLSAAAAPLWSARLTAMHCLSTGSSGALGPDGSFRMRTPRAQKWRDKLCGCANLYIHHRKESIKCKHSWQVACFKIGIFIVLLNSITRASERFFQVLNKLAEWQQL